MGPLSRGYSITKVNATYSTYDLLCMYALLCTYGMIDPYCAIEFMIEASRSAILCASESISGAHLRDHSIEVAQLCTHYIDDRLPYVQYTIQLLGM